MVTTEGNTVKAKSSFAIDRFDFGITYKGKADDLIKKKVALNLDIQAPKV